MPGFEESGRKCKKGRREANSANLLRKIKGWGIESTSQSSKYGVFTKSAQAIKSDGEITIRFPSSEWSEMKWRSKYIAPMGIS